MSIEQTETRNLADSLAKLLPHAEIVSTTQLSEGGRDLVMHVAVPAGQKLEVFDTEKFLPAPRRAVGTPTFDDADSFISYINRHKSAATVVWAKFDPQTFALSFRAVINDLGAQSAPGWRDHAATFTPKTSAEWKVWKEASGKGMSQIDFAGFLEDRADDINGDGISSPTSLQMLAMATEFTANSDKQIKSIIRLQNGGADLVFKDDSDAETISRMRAFDKFRLGIPVFWSELGYLIEARLKWRQQADKVSFTYSLIRPDVAHEAASRALIEKIRAGVGETPLMLGSF